MQVARWVKQVIPMALVFLLFLTACSAAPSKYDQVQQETTGSKAPAAVDKQAEKGGTFNQFFPDAEDGYEVVPSQEKAGFAEYKLKQDGNTVAMLVISDTISLPAAAAKYENATNSVAGYPAVQVGNTATSILVNGRYQVKVLSRDDAFRPEDRAAWIQKFDLQGLSQLEADARLKPQAKKAPSLLRRNKAPVLEPEPTPVLVPQPAT
ncbi:MAG: hypothetical protein ACFBSF_00315 [Leptolyngbyaceae cyanobacterium]